MKHAILVILAILLLNLSAEAQRHITFVEKKEVSVGVIAPKAVFHIEGKKKRKKPTDVVLQKDGKDIGVYGKLEVVSFEQKNSVYSCGGFLFLVPNAHYKMDPTGKFLQTSSGKNVEALIVDISTDYECAKIRFRKDSLAINILESQKLVTDLTLQEVKWSHTSHAISPIIESFAIDSIDPDELGLYTLAVKMEDDKVCGMFRLTREVTHIDGVKKMVYKISTTENLNFSQGEDGAYRLDGKPIHGYVVLKDVSLVSRLGVKRTKHEKRADF